MTLWSLIGVVIVVAGFALRLNAVLVVVTAGVATGLAVGLPIEKILTIIGESFTKQRFLLVLVLTLPVIGLLERNGLREQAHNVVLRLRRLTVGWLLIAYQALRQIAAMFGLTHLGGHPQTVRPLLVPMAEATATKNGAMLDDAARERLRALCAATDNVALFFGEDVFFAFGGVLLMQAFLAQNGIVTEPMQIAIWGLPTALCAFAIQSARSLRFDRQLAREAALLQRGGADT
jgi:uncharacterized membrane protein